MAEIRELKPDEYHFLREMLYASIFVTDESRRPPRSILDEPFVAKYAADFGRFGDVALVACDGLQLVGAAWARLFAERGKSHAFVDAQTPELIVAVRESHRGRGLGTRLFVELLRALERMGFAQVSLSVDRRNRAAGLYRRLGFETIAEDGTALTMLKKFQRI